LNLGWRQEQIVVIDEDLGKSAVSSGQRSGFQNLVADVALGAVGILLVTDVSRLARNCADWYHLLDLASLSDVLVCDAGGVYNPRHYDDRLLLGFKGTFSEAQWYAMRQQLQAARLNKAQRGELALRLPVGYERLADGQVVLAPDEQVQSAIRLVLQLFAQLGSARGVLRRLRQEGVRLPYQLNNRLQGQQIGWRDAHFGAVYQVLRLPAYAGAYTYGKSQRQHLPGVEGKVKTAHPALEEWPVLVHNAWPGYISWEQYLENQRVLAANAAAHFGRGARRLNEGVHLAAAIAKGGGERPTFSPVGEGKALLQGMVYCARCGRPLHVRYRAKPAYVCESATTVYGLPRCQCIPYAHVDEVVVRAFFAAIQPAAIDAALAALAELETQRESLQAQWRLQLERARYEARLAQLRYEQVDPSLRLVAAGLEAAWEEKLQAVVHLEKEWVAAQQRSAHPLSATAEASLRALAADLPGLWAAVTTTDADRKRLLRSLIADVTLDRFSQPGVTRVHIRWHTGASTSLTAASPKPGHPTHPALLARVRTLAQSLTDDKIAAILNQEGLTSPWHNRSVPPAPGQPATWWNRERVRNLRNKHRIPTGVPLLTATPGPRGDGLISAHEAARQLGVSAGAILDWFRRGLLPGHQHRPATPVWVRLDDSNRQRFDGSAARLPQMIPLEQASSRLGFTPDQLLAAIAQQSLLTYRIASGRRFAWYLLPVASC
jgi:DNA invertase Pin-like site-specific DNA recombinase